jgi:hypothetical protein
MALIEATRTIHAQFLKCAPYFRAGSNKDSAILLKMELNLVNKFQQWIEKYFLPLFSYQEVKP